MIKEAAIQRRSDGKVWTGRRHSNAILKIIQEGAALSVSNRYFIQGFITDDERFVDRKEAFKIVVACNQLKDKYDPFAPPTLMSEDLY